MSVALDDQTIFDFTNEARHDFEEGVRLLASGDCEKQRIGEKLVRTSLLLDENDRAREVLQALYSVQNYHIQSDFFATLDSSTKTPSVRSQVH